MNIHIHLYVYGTQPLGPFTAASKLCGNILWQCGPNKVLVSGGDDDAWRLG